MNVKKLVVVGSGTMGAGIGQLCAQQGIEAWITDVSDDLAKKGLDKVKKGLAGRVEKGKLTQAEMDQIMAKLHAAGSLEPVREADFVIESVVENLEVKQKVFAELDKLARPGVILATNTTALSISAIASATKRPELVVQMHFFNPPVIMKLCEIMPGKKTSPKTLQAAEELARALGKEPVVCRAEAPAGIVSRILGAMLNEATWLVEHGVADPKDIDKAMTLGANHPMGPIALLDLIGLDTHRAKMQTLRREVNHPRYDHPAVVDKLIDEKKLGKKVGRGFYDYSEEKK